MIEDNLKEISSRFEARLYGYRMDRKGDFILTLHVNSDDIPEDIVKDRIGQRYMTAMVRMNDQDEPVASPAVEEGNRAVRLAATLCKDEQFQLYMAISGQAEEPTEESVTEGLRGVLGVTSRKELKTNAEARRKLLALRDDFTASLRQRGTFNG